MMNKDKEKALQCAIDVVNKTHGKGSIFAMGDREVEQVPVISTGSPSLDQALGVGGYPRGRIVEIYGPEASGKTTLTLHAIAECQKTGGVAAFIDAEHALDVRYAKALGVDPTRLLLSQPDNGEQALEITETLIRSTSVDLIVIDSVAALVPKAEIEGDMGDPHMGLQARLMSQALRKLTSIAHKTNTTVMFINQLRMKIGVMFGSPETTTGGKALKYYSSVRLDIRRIGALKHGDRILGNRTRVKVVKNKFAPPFRIVEFDIRYGEGIDVVADLIDSAVDRGVIEKNGSHYTYGGERLAQGRERTREVLLQNGVLRAAVEAAMAGEVEKEKEKEKEVAEAA